MFFKKHLTTRWTLHRIHKWMGLIAGVWLIVLGATGFLLDHRDTWRWLWQDGMSAALINESVVGKSKTGHIRLYQINPNNSQQHVSGGLTGLWWSNNKGINWIKTKFIGFEQTPMISSILFSSENKVWIASDNGIWLSKNAGISASLVTLKGKWISALDINRTTKILTGVIERSKIFTYAIKTKKIDYLNIKTIKADLLPRSIGFSRFTRDVHYGRGVFSIPLSLLWNDISAFAMIVLPLSGFLFYWLPKKWRRDIKKKKKISHKHKKQTIRWLFRLHGPTFGLISAIPLVYLSLTGILLDHSNELRTWMKSIEVTQNWQTPVYKLKSWEGEIFGIVNYLDNPEKMSVATRLGLFTTNDNGDTWLREKLFKDKALFVWSIRRDKDNIYIGGMGGPNLIKRGESLWAPIKGVGHMPSDITVDNNDNVFWKSRHGLKSEIVEISTSFPSTNFVPWFYIIDGLHSGALIHSQWKWINDFIAVISIILVVTGCIRWWRKKWI